MGQQIIEHVIKQLQRHHGVHGVPASTTDQVPISGGAPADRFRAKRALTDIPNALSNRWLRRYGGNADHVAATGKHVPMPCTDLTDTEIPYTVDHEIARTISDVLIRRTGSFVWSADGDAAAIDHVSDILAKRFDYSAETRATQQRDYRQWVSRNRGNPTGA